MRVWLASPWLVWGIATVAKFGVIIRPFAWPAFVRVVAGALAAALSSTHV